MRSFFLLLFFVSSSIMTFADEPVNWHRGVIVLKDNQVLLGDVVIQPALDIVLFKSGSETAFFPANQITSVTIRDEHANIPRKFKSISIAGRNGEQNYEFFEVVLPGEFTVVRKPKGGKLSDVDQVFGYVYYIAYDDDMIKLSDFKRKVYPIIQQRVAPDALKKFIKDERIDTNDISGAIRLLDFYNQRAVDL